MAALLVLSITMKYYIWSIIPPAGFVRLVHMTGLENVKVTTVSIKQKFNKLIISGVKVLGKKQSLHENTCYCLKPDFKLEKVPREKCSRECSGNRNNLCGGVNEAFKEYITVYNDSQEIQTLDVPGDGECLTVEIISKQKQYKARRCISKLHVLCQNESGHVEKEHKKDWYDALNICKTNFELANDQFIADNIVQENKEFWVGYFRESYSVWEKTIDDSSPVSLTTMSSLSLSTRQPNEQKDENRSLDYAEQIIKKALLNHLAFNN
ncbi:hypothetical protein KUTeg_004081 [Tegillarca granosa]|uniref:WSC domain-containing protein n=1 Tax=Tegillarca granosa TaxID=220873 RepID=A0ABQ9FTG7_TEGGR|nr:hypothetical protein KUTeg_004081 [Tegillarca granosa]